MRTGAVPISPALYLSPTDEKDVAYVALALHLDAELWSEDEELKIGLRARGFDRFL